MHKITYKKNEISILYNANCSKAKKAMAYAKSLAEAVDSIEYGKWGTTATKWKEILHMLNKQPKDILDKSNPYYQANLRGREFEDRDWLNVVMRNPDLIRSPIAIRGRKAIFLDNPTDIYRI